MIADGREELSGGFDFGSWLIPRQNKSNPAGLDMISFGNRPLYQGIKFQMNESSEEMLFNSSSRR